MAELLAFLDYADTSVYGKLFDPVSSRRHVYTDNEDFRSFRQDTATIANPDFLKIQELLLEFQRTVTRVEKFTEFDIPDVFELKPLESQRIALTIRETKPANFYFVAESDEFEE
ncbi:MAG: hypothetical protein ACOYYJ_18725 [Chloroflexota bacterium]